jgi:hypothetical protein
MNISYDKQRNMHTCMVCGRDFRSYNSAYQHIKRAHENHPSMQTNRESFDNQTVPSAPLFGNNQAVRYEPVYYEPVHYERRHSEEREVREKEDNGKGAAIAIFIIGMIVVGVWLYLRFFKGKFDFSGILANNAVDEDEDVEPAFRVNNSMPVTKDGAYPVFEVRGEA